MLGRLLSITRKEVLHIRRDPRTLAVMFLIPVIQMFLLGYAATTDVEHLRTAVLDQDKTPASRELIDAYKASNYFDLVYYVDEEGELARLIDSGRARAGLIIPAGYGETVTRGERATVAFIIDGSDPNVAGTAFSAAQSIAQAYSAQLIEAKLDIKLDETIGVEAIPRVWYNPEMRSTNFMIPGLIGTIMMLMTVILTSLAIVREREQGTIEQLVVTPITPFELVVGKIIPYVGVAFFDLGEILVVGTLWFDVPVRGSIPLLLALAFLFIFTALGFGLLISTVARTQQEAMFLSYFVFLPSIFLSGFFFPLEAMPRALQLISYLVPLRYFLIIVRGIILKGVGIELLKEQVYPLVLFGTVLILMAANRFRKRLE